MCKVNYIESCIETHFKAIDANGIMVITSVYLSSLLATDSNMLLRMAHLARLRAIQDRFCSTRWLSLAS